MDILRAWGVTPEKLFKALVYVVVLPIQIAGGLFALLAIVMQPSATSSGYENILPGILHFVGIGVLTVGLLLSFAVTLFERQRGGGVAPGGAEPLH